MFNENVKNDYLINNDSEVRDVFEISSQIESIFGKDLYDFTEFELQEVFNQIDFENKDEAKTVLRVVNDYINWAIEQKLSAYSINPLSGMSDDFMMQFVNA